MVLAKMCDDYKTDFGRVSLPGANCSTLAICCAAGCEEQCTGRLLVSQACSQLAPKHKSTSITNDQQASPTMHAV
jgi:hypothetical protein